MITIAELIEKLSVLQAVTGADAFVNVGCMSMGEIFGFGEMTTQPNPSYSPTDDDGQVPLSIFIELDRF